MYQTVNKVLVYVPNQSEINEKYIIPVLILYLIIFLIFSYFFLRDRDWVNKLVKYFFK